MIKKSALAAIDLGSNSIRLVCAYLQGPPFNAMKILSKKLIVVRLGEGFEPDRHLKPSAMDRAIVALKDLSCQIRGSHIDQIQVVTTGVVMLSIFVYGTTLWTYFTFFKKEKEAVLFKK